MKNWTARALEKLLEGKVIRIFGAPRPVQPFPGKYPTRIYLRAKDFKYFGKPSINAYQAMRQAWVKDPYDFTTIEFDKAGPIYLEGRTGPQHSRQQILNESCWGVYHPQTFADPTLSWMCYGIKTLGHRYVIGAEGLRGVR